MLYREIIAVCSQIHTKHINTLCGQNAEWLNVKLAVHKAITRLLRVDQAHTSRIVRFFAERTQKPVRTAQSPAGSLAHVMGLRPGMSWVRLRLGGKRFVSPKTSRLALGFT